MLLWSMSSCLSTALAVSTAALLVGVVCFFIWLVYKLSIDRKKRLTDKIPGYVDWPIVGDMFHLKRDPVEFYSQVMHNVEVNRKHGIQKLRLGYLPIVYLFTPDEIQKLLNSSTHIEKSAEYSYMHSWIGLGLSTSGGNKWRSRRKMLMPSFHFNMLKDYLASMNKHTSVLRTQLQSEIRNKNEPFDIFAYMKLVTLDIICDTAMGVEMNALQNGESEYVKAADFVKEAVAVRQRTPWYWPDWLYRTLPIGQAVDRGIKVMHQFALKVIKERRVTKGEFEQSRKHKAFIDILLDSKDEFGNSLTDEDIREEVDTFMFAGHSSASTATSYAIYLLGAHEQFQRRCQQELDKIMDKPREFTTDDLSKMNYLEWCIKEALRLYPPAPWFGRELTEDTEFGYLVPKGVTVAVFTAALHRDFKIYPDPECFDPTRFSPENCSTRHPYAFLPFSGGPRGCIGYKFAIMELKVIIATVLLHFNIESTQTREEVKPSPGLSLQPSAGVWVKLTSRI